MYPIPGSEPSQRQSRNEPVDHSKVNTVCDAVRKALLETGERRYISQSMYLLYSLNKQISTDNTHNIYM